VTAERGDPEAVRLAAQRTSDIERGAFERGVAAAELAARLDAIEALAAGQGVHLKEINGSQAEAVTQLREIKQELRDLNRDMHSSVKRGVEITQRRFTRVQSWGVILMAVFAFGSLLVLVIQAIGHG
jgi:uncharacterized coiled-coil protein SlyX